MRLVIPSISTLTRTLLRNVLARFVAETWGVAIRLGFLVLIAWFFATSLHNRLYPPPPGFQGGNAGSFGAVRLRIQLPGTSAGIPEPLLVVGKPGRASLIYIRLLHNAHAKVGVEFWGVEKDEGEEFSLPGASASIEVTCYLPSLYPKGDDPYWGSLSKDIQRTLRTTYLVSVDGVARLKGKINYEQPPGSPLYFGENGVGGDIVARRFSGSVLNVSRQ